MIQSGAVTLKDEHADSTLEPCRKLGDLMSHTWDLSSNQSMEKTALASNNETTRLEANLPRFTLASLS